MKFAVFTDLDGTFLDHHSYDCEAAIPVVRKLASAGIPVFSVSSKTLAEQKALFDSQGLFDGYVAENGGVVWYRDTLHVLGPTQLEIAQARDAIEQMLGHEVPSFRIQYIEQVIQATGLDRESAALACQRMCSDPLILTVNSRQEAALNQVINQNRTRLVRGGRFLTLCGHADKAQAMRFLIKQHFPVNPRVTTIALGDSPNDLPMLRAADYGIWMPNPAGSSLSVQEREGLIQAPQSGPVGWSEAILQLFDSLQVNLN